MKKSLLFKFVVLFLAFTSTVFTVNAQVTTSAMNGLIKDPKGALPGASVKATHTPSGTVYLVSTNNDGRFSIGNMRIGGPYTVEITYIGYEPAKISDIYLKLGESYNVDYTLNESGKTLTEVTVVGTKNKISGVKTGASTTVSSRELATLPTISRSISDFTRLTPQAGSNNSFGGRDGRYNNIQVDGANLNNNFGLSADPLPGGGAQPISLDSYDQISVNIAPFDVRQAGFTGASINAVTKSGTNTFHGTAYGLYRDQSFLGTKVGDNDISSSISNSEAKTYGFSLGGPIIKNKLFFFVNAEKEKSTRPGISYAADGSGGAGTASSTKVEDLKRVSDYLFTKFGYETGSYTDFPQFAADNHKILAKIDWNINNNHKLSVKYSDFVGTDGQQLNNTSIPNGGGFRVGAGTGTISRLPNNRFGPNSFSYANSNYGFKNTTRSGTVELNSRFSNKFSNQLLLAVTKNQATRDYPGSIFPTIDIFDASGNNYITAGMDPYTLNNDVVNDIYSFTDNVTYYAGQHTLTAGLTYEYQKTGNMFMAPANSYYAFNSIDDLLNDRSPAYYAYTYSLIPNQSAVYSAELKLGQAGAYIQDEWNVTDNVKFTFGLRADMPVYHEKPLNNPATSKLNFYDSDNFSLRNYTTDHWAKSKVMLSPRFGFRINSEDKSTVLRGGMGVFTGKIPFVFLTNIPTNTGMYQYGGAFSNVRDAATLRNIKLSSDPAAYSSLFPTTAGTSSPSNVVFMNDNFKFPKIFRVNLGVDKNLGNGFMATFDGIFTKDINAVRMRNANLLNPTGVIIEGGMERPRIVGPTNRLNSNITSAIVLENSSRGYAASLTGQLSKSFSGGFSGSVAYTYSKAEEISANPGSQAASVWNTNPNVGTSNFEEMGNSAFAVPHRVVASLSYRFEYLKHLATSVSVFYEGTNQGVYSFVVNGDLNGDGNSSADLMYIPKAGETNFIPLTVKDANNNNVTFTPAQQEAALNQYIENSPYLRKNRGEFAKRNAALLPWINKVDVRFLQDIFIRTGNSGKQTLQFSADITNFANLLNKNWGTYQRYIVNNPLAFKSVNSNNQPVYTMAQSNGKLVTDTFQDNLSVASTYSIQLGLRYIF